MSSSTDRGNRFVLVLLGVLLLAAGVLGLVASFEGFGGDRAGSPVLPEDARTVAADQPWFWWAVAAACLLLALLGLLWLLAQLRTDRVGRLDLTTDDRDGVTTVHAGALADAVEAEARTVRGVSDASAHLRGSPTRRLALQVDLTDYADIAEVRSALEQRTVSHARQAIDDPALAVDIELRPGASRSGRRGLT